MTMKKKKARFDLPAMIMTRLNLLFRQQEKNFIVAFLPPRLVIIDFRRESAATRKSKIDANFREFFFSFPFFRSLVEEFRMIAFRS